MAREPLRNVGASVRARLLQRSRDSAPISDSADALCTERLLYPLSQSDIATDLSSRGAMLFVTWVEAPFRPTRDLDLLGYGENSPEAIGDTFRAICRQPVDDDGVAFDVDGLEAAPIREDIEYGGVRIRTQAIIDGARIPIQVDVGFGDAITPGPIEIDYPVLLDAPTPRVRAYPIETVVAEKFHALATRA
ncbi:MAG: nucleotidyl transferase AbiEii/AbiGii toxin family protein, partial [Proteobacteria bacterium]|nr:nucleotidyl transferase AbiEii/AbiGii toxin family protein [Pseudomonadota bacterium]